MAHRANGEIGEKIERQRKCERLFWMSGIRWQRTQSDLERKHLFRTKSENALVKLRASLAGDYKIYIGSMPDWEPHQWPIDRKFQRINQLPDQIIIIHFINCSLLFISRFRLRKIRFDVVQLANPSNYKMSVASIANKSSDKARPIRFDFAIDRVAAHLRRWTTAADAQFESSKVRYLHFAWPLAKSLQSKNDVNPYQCAHL